MILLFDVILVLCTDFVVASFGEVLSLFHQGPKLTRSHEAPQPK